MNYFLQVFVKERGEWKIAESVVAPTEQIVQNGDGFGMKEEMVYGDRECEITSSLRGGYFTRQENLNFNKRDNSR